MAEISVVYPLSQISVAFGSLIRVGADSVLSIALRAKDKDEKTQERLLGNVNWLSLVSTIIYMFFALIFSTKLVQVMEVKNGSGIEHVLIETDKKECFEFN